MMRILHSDSLHEEMRQNALSKAREFSWEQAAADHIRTYESVMDFSPSRPD